ncbi:MAG: 2-octaprenyl-6-methoxyphenyl hydroxylase [Burkholderiaceae bacterium]|nr:MAG: 2-octaprenyl-6-methoxyphenyl hydroxylase [Burkholderiaceae bacterium]
MAIIGAGPAGLALAHACARRLDDMAIHVFDTRPLDQDLRRDPRTLALAWGSVMWLKQQGLWAEGLGEPILDIDVSQATPAPGWRPVDEAVVSLSAQEMSVPMLGAVVAYGPLLAPMHEGWLSRCQAQPGRCHAHFGRAVGQVMDEGSAVRLAWAPGADAQPGDPAETLPWAFDLVVVAEGGVFADQSRKALSHDYGQSAWVGQVTLRDMPQGLAVERFTREGPLALLPLGGDQWALVWCRQTEGDDVAGLDDAQRVTLLNALLPPRVGEVVAVSPLKRFALGLNAETSLVSGRQIRIGNAAQTLHPVAGQGLNLGLRDVHQLVAALARAHDVPGALRQAQWARAGDRWVTIAATDFLARSFTWPIPMAGTARALGLAALQHFRLLKAALARHMMFGWR